MPDLPSPPPSPPSGGGGGGPRRVRFSDAPSAPEAPRSRTDELIDKARTIDNGVEPMRIKGRITTLLDMTVTDLLDWGERNLAPLRDASNKKAEIAAEMSRINAFGWLNDAKEASSKPPSFFDRFNQKSPQYYEGMLQKARAEMLEFAKTLNKMREEFEREVKDLHLDALALTVCWDEYGDLTAKQIGQDRARTLTLAHQTAAMLFATIEQSLTQSASAVQQIDSFLAVTMPNWKMANG